MSQNYFQSGNRVMLIGWDKPTQQAFLTVGELNENGEWREPLLVEIDYPFDRVNSFHYVDEIITSMKSKLAMIGERIPDVIYHYVTEDIRVNSVNVCRIHYQDKDILLYHGDPFVGAIFSRMH